MRRKANLPPRTIGGADFKNNIHLSRFSRDSRHGPGFPPSFVVPPSALVGDSNRSALSTVDQHTKVRRTTGYGRVQNTHLTVKRALPFQRRPGNPQCLIMFGTGVRMSPNAAAPFRTLWSRHPPLVLSHPKPGIPLTIPSIARPSVTGGVTKLNGRF